MFGRFDDAEELALRTAGHAEAAGDQIACARACQLLSHLAAARGDGAGAIEHGWRALSLLGTEDGAHRRWSLYGVGLGHLLQGELDEAASLLDQAGATGLAADQQLLGGGVVLSHLGLIRAIQGDPAQAERYYQDVLGRQGEAMTISRSAALVRLGELRREHDRLDEAATLLSDGLALAERPGGLYAHEAALGLARVHAARGDLEAAEAALARAEAAAARLGHATAVERARAYGIRWRLAVSDLLAATRQAAGLRLSPAELAQYQHEGTALTLVRLWTAQGRAERALELLDRLRPPAEATGRLASVVEMLALEALAEAARGDEARALTCLAHAAALAERSGFVRLLVDEGAPMARLLEALVAARRRGDLAGRSPSAQYLGRLLTSFGGRVVEQVAAVPATTLAAGRSLGLVEPLSSREREVLALMATGAGNQQIADQLVVAVTTIKTHVNGIFRKLDVTSRIEAVARARELGLFGGTLAAAPARVASI
jgi:LuxR family maltose regulon positive regulatory protein